MQKTRFVIIGTGVVGERVIRQIQQQENTEIVAIFDRDEIQLQKIAKTYQLHAVKSYEAALDFAPDWVYIGTPPSSHATLALQAMEQGIHVLCEKPLAHHVAEAESMATAAEQHQVKTAMHFPLMYSPVVNYMKTCVEKGEIGSIRRIELQAYFPQWPRTWQQNDWIATRHEGGFVREIFPHYFQLMNHMFGQLSFDYTHIKYPLDPGVSENDVMAFGQTEKDIPFYMQGLSDIGMEEELSFIVYGTEGVLKLRNWSELYHCVENSPFERLTNELDTNSLIESCVLSHQGKPSSLVSFSEGLTIQRYIETLVMKS